MTLHIRRPRPALVIASLALAVATSGTTLAVAATLQNGDSLIAVNSLSANRIRTHTVTITQMSQLAWGAVILENGWANAVRAPKAAMDAQGIVHLKGAVQGGRGTTIGTLPKADAPTGTIYLAAHSNKGTTVGIIVRSNGSIIMQGTVGPDMYVGLEGITYAR